MKKAISLLLFFAISVGALCGCGIFGDYYELEVTGSKNELLTPLRSHYPAGQEVTFELPILCDAGIYVFLNGKQIDEDSYDSDLGIRYFKFVMPAEKATLHLTFDKFYGVDYYDFKDVCSDYSIITSRGIDKVALRIYDYEDGTPFITTHYSTKAEDIERFQGILNNRLMKVDSDRTADRHLYRYYVFYNVDYSPRENAYVDQLRGQIDFVGDYYSYLWNMTSMPQSFAFVDDGYTLPTVEDPDLTTYSFKRTHKKCYIKSYGGDLIPIMYTSLESIEFIPYTGSGDELLNIGYFLDTEYGRIDLLSPTVFGFDGKYYEIVKNANYWAYNRAIEAGK